MSLFAKRETTVLVLRDAPEIITGLRELLSAAPDDERAGLARALDLVEEFASRPDAELRARWVRQRLAAADYRGAPDEVAGIKALRGAEPGLTLLQAVTYAKEAAAGEPGVRAD
ncbi:hypothetical protein [uncultured Streptomyces sp.]|uniref:hypothetical protein n=1 Tax=uncultured Streptomyces sp. TaxID=174707 RepID=UPI002631F0DB|nr:hypothetical protein [uncultured Streptomyces sp.]